MHAMFSFEHDLAWMQEILLHPMPSGGHPALLELARHCSGLIVLEHEKLPEDLQEYLTMREAQRADRMGLKRRQGFLAVHLGLKLLARFLCPDLQHVPANSLHTMDDDSPLPMLPSFNGADKLAVSASHNKHLTVVAASSNIFGIDVEDRAAQAWRGRNFFMHHLEKEMARQSPLGPEKAALRIWSCKEAAAKAFNIDLTQAVWDVRLTEIGDRASSAQYQSQKHDVHHFVVYNNLISALIKPRNDATQICRTLG